MATTLGEPHMTSPHRVVVIGGGFGGLPAARLLSQGPVDVTLVDRRNHHLFQPLLYQVATGVLSPGQISPALRHVLRRSRNVVVQQADVTRIDLDRRVVHAVALGRIPVEFPYDSLIVAAGVTQSYFGNDDFAFIAPGMKTIDDALELRRRIFGAFEVAEMTGDPTEKAHWLSFVIVGAGPTGVELAGQICEVARRSLKGEFRTFDPATVRVFLVDAGREPLATFGDKLSGRAARELGRLGVELRMGSRVTGVDAGGVDVAGDGSTGRIEAGTVIWAAGVEASPLARQLADATGADLDRAGRVAVRPDLTLPNHPEVFVVGDMASINDLPGVAEVAMQGGLHAANTILRRLKGEEGKDFRYRDLGSVATIGRFHAVVSFRGIRVSGFPGWVIWMFVHLAFLTGFGNRMITMLRWMRSMIGRGRAERSFSTAHTGGDLSLPEQVRNRVQGVLFPIVESTVPSGSSGSAEGDRAEGDEGDRARRGPR